MVCSYLVSRIPSFSNEYKCFFGEDCFEQFYEYLSPRTKELMIKYFLNPAPILMSDEQKAEYMNTKKCYRCEYEFRPLDQLMVLYPDPSKRGNYLKNRDHDHNIYDDFNYRGALCGACNLSMRVKFIFPVGEFRN